MMTITHMGKTSHNKEKQHTFFVYVHERYACVCMCASIMHCVSEGAPGSRKSVPRPLFSEQSLGYKEKLNGLSAPCLPVLFWKAGLLMHP